MNTQNPYSPPRASVSDVTGSGDGDDFELAGRGVRLGAAFLDSIIGSLLIYLPLVIGGLDMKWMYGGEIPDISPLWGFVALSGLVVWIVLTTIYVARNGQTIAKKLLGIKVVRSDGSKASLGRIFWLRNVVNAILGVIPLYGLIDLLVIFGDARQCVHDKIADTIVVVA